MIQPVATHGLLAALILIPSLASAQTGEKSGEKLGGEETAGYLRLKSGPLEIAVDPAVGGRLASFTLDGQEILRTRRDENNWHWGSSIWSSPQSDWGWPPPAYDRSEFDVVEQTDTRLVLESEPDPKQGLKVTKEIEMVDQEGPAAKITVSLTNVTDAPIKAAVWSTTRVPFDGVTQYPAGGTTRLLKDDKPINTTTSDDVTALSFDESQPDSQKIFYAPPKSSNAMTWNGYWRDGLVFIKRFPNARVAAPGEAALELYLAPKNDFAELELQGEYETIGPGESTSLTVYWYLLSEGDPRIIKLMK